MGLFSKDIKSIEDLFVHQLQDIDYAEKRIVGALPEMIRKSTTPELGAAFESHLQETKTQVQRLEQVFGLIGTEPQSVGCPAIDDIIDEADEVAGEVADKTVLDAALIAAGQSVEHYEIARYGTLDRLGEGARQGRLREAAGGNPGGRGRRRQEVDLDRRAGRQPRRRLRAGRFDRLRGAFPGLPGKAHEVGGKPVCGSGRRSRHPPDPGFISAAPPVWRLSSVSGPRGRFRRLSESPRLAPSLP